MNCLQNSRSGCGNLRKARMSTRISFGTYIKESNIINKLELELLESNLKALSYANDSVLQIESELNWKKTFCCYGRMQVKRIKDEQC